MSSSLSITSSDSGAPSQARAFWFRLGLFSAPIILIAIIISALALASGELLPVWYIAGLQASGRPFLYQPRFSDHVYRLKVDAVLLTEPEILAMGSSRANQWRSAMFRPQRFYNAGDSVYTFRDYSRMLGEFRTYRPRMIIFSLDFFMFGHDWGRQFSTLSHSDLSGWNSPDTNSIRTGLLPTVLRGSLSLLPTLHDPLHGVPALGLLAVRSGTGLRNDGSLQYGSRILFGQQTSLREYLGRVASGQSPFAFDDRIDAAKRQDFLEFVAQARKRGIRLVGISTAFAPPLVAALSRSPHHGIWREFQRPEFAAWIRSQGVVYFNFTGLDSFGGRTDEFVDPVHPSEPAHIRMLLTMLRDPRFQSLVPDLNVQKLDEQLARSSTLESFRNEY